MEDIDFVRSRVAEDEAIREFNRQRDHLEKQVAALKHQLAKSLGGSKSDIGKIMDVSYKDHKDGQYSCESRCVYNLSVQECEHVPNVVFWTCL